MRAPLSLLPRVVAETIEHSYGHHRTPWFEGILERIGLSLAPALGARVPLMLTSTTPGRQGGAWLRTAWRPGGASGRPPGARSFRWWRHGAAFAIEWPGATAFEADGGEDRRSCCSITCTRQARFWMSSAASRASGEPPPKALIVVDATVSFGADIASFDGLAIDAVLLAPEGALMGIPGLTIVAAGARLLEHVRRCRKDLQIRPFYFDLLRYEKTWAKRTTPFSPDISASIALCKALELIEANGGLRGHVERHAARAVSVRRALTGCGLIPVLPEGQATNAFTIVDLPGGLRRPSTRNGVIVRRTRAVVRRCRPPGPHSRRSHRVLA